MDTVSGPKIGTSKIYRIKIRDREAVMAGLDRNLGEISNELLDLLGDYLEKDLPPEDRAKEAKETGKPAPKGGSIEKKAAKILERIKRTRAVLRPKNPRESLSDMDLSTLERQLRDAISQYLKPLSRLSKLGKNAQEEKKSLNREIAARQEEATETLERLATMGEEIQRNVRVDRAAARRNRCSKDKGPSSRRWRKCAEWVRTKRPSGGWRRSWENSGSSWVN